MIAYVKKYLHSLLYLFFPPHCVVCDAVLEEGEEIICLACNIDMPRTNFHLESDNPVERMFWGKLPLVRASSYFYYNRGSGFRRLLHQLKYYGRKDIGEIMGRFVAEELKRTGFFKDIDLILPVPLHPLKQKDRGYNQSVCIAQGISAVTGIPMDTTSVVRCKNSTSQTDKSVYERWKNVSGIFKMNSSKNLVRKHVLIVDDVLTTGATITACADTFCVLEGVRVSVLTLALAKP